MLKCNASLVMKSPVTAPLLIGVLFAVSSLSSSYGGGVSASWPSSVTPSTVS